MTVRLLLGVAVAANVLVLIACTGQTSQGTATSVSSASATSSYASSSSSAKVVSSKSVKCRKVKKCPKNEEFSHCPDSIQRAQYCLEKAEPSTYRGESEKPCEEGCVCKENYLRAENGTCIPAEQCPLTCGVNEVLVKCPSFCESDYCPMTEQDTFALPCLAHVVCPPPVCRCTFNHHRAANGSCIPTRECPPFDCSHRSNEEYNACPPLCPTDDCSQASPTGECPPQFGNIGIVLPCNPRCRCNDGYWRLDGTCVPYGQCPGVCPDNERYSTCIQAECRALNCTQKDQSVPCIRLDPSFCEKGCVCQEGYLRNQDDICVLEEKCEPTCPVHEEYVPCIQGVCRAKECSERGQDVPCPDIPPEQCDSGCICKEGFLRAGNGSCVPEDQCENITCPVNEEFNECTQIVCRAQKCIAKNWPIACPGIAAGSCIKGCVCQQGYLRDERGVCIPDNECTPNPCQPNEEFSTCTQAICRTLNCSDKGKPQLCPLVAEGDCLEGCVCQEGYLRSEYGYCIPEQQCDDYKCSIWEQWNDCANAVCKAEFCTQKGLPVPCPSVSECVPGCLCRDNYLRDESGFCVPEEECTTCGENEVLDDCPMMCNTDYCPLSADEEQACTQADPCVPACKCRFNYKRAENGTCIPTRYCPPFDCSAKRNEEFVACPPYCPTDECGKPRLDGHCPFRIGVVLKCNPKCQCKDGYGRVNGTCVLFEECPNLCPANEMYSPCVQQTCRPQTCSDRDLAMETCPTCKADECQQGCVCQENYYRNDKGDCVTYEECGGPMCPNAHEVYEHNFKECPPNICDSLVARYPCNPTQKIGLGYRCKDGFLKLNLTESCVPICDCSEMKYSADCPK